MANRRNGNSFYIDTQYSASTDDLATPNIRVTQIVVSATAANAILVLSDPTTGDNKAEFRVATSGDSSRFPFYDNPLVFPNGIRVLTLTNAHAFCVLDNTSK